MDTNICVALLLPVLAAPAFAQDLKLDIAAQPALLKARVYGASPESLVVLVLGLREARMKLPGGQILGVQPDLVTGYVFAKDFGAATFTVQLPRHAAAIECLAQAVAVQPKMSPDGQLGTTVSAVQKVHIHASGSNQSVVRSAGCRDARPLRRAPRDDVGRGRRIGRNGA